MKFQARLAKLLAKRNAKRNMARTDLIQACVKNKEAVISACGALATWTHPESSGRSPLDTLIVRRPANEKSIDWNAANNISLDPKTFDMMVADAFKTLGGSGHVYASDRVIGADASYAMPVTTVSNTALTQVFVDNMFRPALKGIKKSIFADKPFTVLVCPHDKFDPQRYDGRVRVDPRIGTTSMLRVTKPVAKSIPGKKRLSPEASGTISARPDSAT